jgi:hypothetical protein
MPQGDTVLKNEVLKRLAATSQTNTKWELEKHRDSKHYIRWNIHENAFFSARAFFFIQRPYRIDNLELHIAFNNMIAARV